MLHVDKSALEMNEAPLQLPVSHILKSIIFNAFRPELI
jgi:hypothetical protein